MESVDEAKRKGDGGLKEVLDFLKEHIGEDEVIDVCEKIKNFIHMKREPDQTVREYVSNFEHAYTVAQNKAKMEKLPGQYLMYALIYNVNISDHDRKLVLSGVDLTKPDAIYKDTKTALLKYCGDAKTAACAEGGGAFLAPESTFWTGTRRKFPPKKPRPGADNKDFNPDGYHPRIQRDNMRPYNNKMNPKKNGITMTCDFCGSYLHLQKDCYDKKKATRNRTYAVEDGVELDDGPARFSDIQEGGGDGINRFFYVVLMEGRNREVRRLWESQGTTVSRLKRVRYGEVFLPSKLKKGQWLELPQRDVDVIYEMAGLPTREVASLSKKDLERRQRFAKKGQRVAGRRSRRND